MNHIVVMTVSDCLQYLTHVMRDNSFGKDVSIGCTLYDLKANVGAAHVLEDHVQKACARVDFFELNDMFVLEHVADCCFPLEIVNRQARG